MEKTIEYNLTWALISSFTVSLLGLLIALIIFSKKKLDSSISFNFETYLLIVVPIIFIVCFLPLILEKLRNKKNG